MNKEELEQEIIELNKDIEFRQKVIDSLCETKKMYIDRIQKAIEYISKHNCIATYEEYKPTEYEYCCSADLLDILRGNDNE